MATVTMRTMSPAGAKTRRPDVHFCWNRRSAPTSVESRARTRGPPRDYRHEECAHGRAGITAPADRLPAVRGDDGRQLRPGQRRTRAENVACPLRAGFVADMHQELGAVRTDEVHDVRDARVREHLPADRQRRS